MNYYNEIKKRIIEYETFTNNRDDLEERYNLVIYYEVGKLLLESCNLYGESIINYYAIKLMQEINKKYNFRILRRMKQLYLFLEQQKWPLVEAELINNNCR